MAVSIVNKIFRRLFSYGTRAGRQFARLKCKLIGQIKLAPTTVIAPKAKLVIDKHSDLEHVIEIGSGSIIKDYAMLCPRTGFIKIGKKCSVNPYCVLLGYGGITIGDYVRIAAHTSIIAFNHNFDDTDQTIYEQGNNDKGIVIEDDVWIGTGVRILDGVTIGTGSVIGAGSVVTKDIPPYSICVGVPAKPIKQRSRNIDENNAGKNNTEKDIVNS